MPDYRITRPIMTAAELEAHKVATYGRNYRLSDDGYDDMGVNATQGWHVLSSWGSDGWDLGTWPYVAISVRDRDRFELLSVCEGDHTSYSFATVEDRDAALDYLFLWYIAGAGLDCSIGEENRGRLDVGDIAVADRFRGPYRTTSPTI